MKEMFGELLFGFINYLVVFGKGIYYVHYFWILDFSFIFIGVAQSLKVRQSRIIKLSFQHKKTQNYLNNS